MSKPLQFPFRRVGPKECVCLRCDWRGSTNAAMTLAEFLTAWAYLSLACLAAFLILAADARESNDDPHHH